MLSPNCSRRRLQLVSLTGRRVSLPRHPRAATQHSPTAVRLPPPLQCGDLEDGELPDSGDDCDTFGGLGARQSLAPISKLEVGHQLVYTRPFLAPEVPQSPTVIGPTYSVPSTARLPASTRSETSGRPSPLRLRTRAPNGQFPVLPMLAPGPPRVAAVRPPLYVAPTRVSDRASVRTVPRAPAPGFSSTSRRTATPSSENKLSVPRITVFDDSPLLRIRTSGNSTYTVEHKKKHTAVLGSDTKDNSKTTTTKRTTKTTTKTTIEISSSSSSQDPSDSSFDSSLADEFRALEGILTIEASQGGARGRRRRKALTSLRKVFRTSHSVDSAQSSSAHLCSDESEAESALIDSDSEYFDHKRIGRDIMRPPRGRRHSVRQSAKRFRRRQSLAGARPIVLLSSSDSDIDTPPPGPHFIHNPPVGSGAAVTNHVREPDSDEYERENSSGCVIHSDEAPSKPERRSLRIQFQRDRVANDEYLKQIGYIPKGKGGPRSVARSKKSARMSSGRSRAQSSSAATSSSRRTTTSSRRRTTSSRRGLAADGGGGDDGGDSDEREHKPKSRHTSEDDDDKKKKVKRRRRRRPSVSPSPAPSPVPRDALKKTALRRSTRLKKRAAEEMDPNSDSSGGVANVSADGSSVNESQGSASPTSRRRRNAAKKKKKTVSKPKSKRRKVQRKKGGAKSSVADESEDAYDSQATVDASDSAPPVDNCVQPATWREYKTTLEDKQKTLSKRHPLSRRLRKANWKTREGWRKLTPTDQLEWLKFVMQASTPEIEEQIGDIMDSVLWLGQLTLLDPNQFPAIKDMKEAVAGYLEAHSSEINDDGTGLPANLYPFDTENLDECLAVYFDIHAHIRKFTAAGSVPLHKRLFDVYKKGKSEGLFDKIIRDTTWREKLATDPNVMAIALCYYTQVGAVYVRIDDYDVVEILKCDCGKMAQGMIRRLYTDSTNSTMVLRNIVALKANGIGCANPAQKARGAYGPLMEKPSDFPPSAPGTEIKVTPANYNNIFPDAVNKEEYRTRPTEAVRQWSDTVPMNEALETDMRTVSSSKDAFNRSNDCNQKQYKQSYEVIEWGFKLKESVSYYMGVLFLTNITGLLDGFKIGVFESKEQEEAWRRLAAIENEKKKLEGAKSKESKTSVRKTTAAKRKSKAQRRAATEPLVEASSSTAPRAAVSVSAASGAEVNAEAQVEVSEVESEWPKNLDFVQPADNVFKDIYAYPEFKGSWTNLTFSTHLAADRWGAGGAVSEWQRPPPGVELSIEDWRRLNNQPQFPRKSVRAMNEMKANIMDPEGGGRLENMGTQRKYWRNAIVLFALMRLSSETDLYAIRPLLQKEEGEGFLWRMGTEFESTPFARRACVFPMARFRVFAIPPGVGWQPDCTVPLVATISLELDEKDDAQSGDGLHKVEKWCAERATAWTGRIDCVRFNPLDLAVCDFRDKERFTNAQRTAVQEFGYRCRKDAVRLAQSQMEKTTSASFVLHKNETISGQSVKHFSFKYCPKLVKGKSVRVQLCAVRELNNCVAMQYLKTEKRSNRGKKATSARAELSHREQAVKLVEDTHKCYVRCSTVDLLKAFGTCIVTTHDFYTALTEAEQHKGCLALWNNKDEFRHWLEHNGVTMSTERKQLAYEIIHNAKKRSFDPCAHEYYADTMRCLHCPRPQLDEWALHLAQVAEQLECNEIHNLLKTELADGSDVATRKNLTQALTFLRALDSAKTMNLQPHTLFHDREFIAKACLKSPDASRGPTAIRRELSALHLVLRQCGAGLVAGIFGAQLKRCVQAIMPALTEVMLPVKARLRFDTLNRAQLEFFSASVTVPEFLKRVDKRRVFDENPGGSLWDGRCDEDMSGPRKGLYEQWKALSAEELFAKEVAIMEILALDPYFIAARLSESPLERCDSLDLHFVIVIATAARQAYYRYVHRRNNECLDEAAGECAERFKWLGVPHFIRSLCNDDPFDVSENLRASETEIQVMEDVYEREPTEALRIQLEFARQKKLEAEVYDTWTKVALSGPKVRTQGATWASMEETMLNLGMAVAVTGDSWMSLMIETPSPNPKSERTVFGAHRAKFSGGPLGPFRTFADCFGPETVTHYGPNSEPVATVSMQNVGFKDNNTRPEADMGVCTDPIVLTGVNTVINAQMAEEFEIVQLAFAGDGWAQAQDTRMRALFSDKALEEREDNFDNGEKDVSYLDSPHCWYVALKRIFTKFDAANGSAFQWTIGVMQAKVNSRNPGLPVCSEMELYGSNLSCVFMYDLGCDLVGKVRNLIYTVNSCSDTATTQYFETRTLSEALFGECANFDYFLKFFEKFDKKDASATPEEYAKVMTRLKPRLRDLIKYPLNYKEDFRKLIPQFLKRFLDFQVFMGKMQAKPQLTHARLIEWAASTREMNLESLAWTDSAADEKEMVRKKAKLNRFLWKKMKTMKMNMDYVKNIKGLIMGVAVEEDAAGVRAERRLSTGAPEKSGSVEGLVDLTKENEAEVPLLEDIPKSSALADASSAQAPARRLLGRVSLADAVRADVEMKDSAAVESDSKEEPLSSLNKPQEMVDAFDEMLNTGDITLKDTRKLELALKYGRVLLRELKANGHILQVKAVLPSLRKLTRCVKDWDGGELRFQKLHLLRAIMDYADGGPLDECSIPPPKYMRARCSFEWRRIEKGEIKNIDKMVLRHVVERTVKKPKNVRDSQVLVANDYKCENPHKNWKLEKQPLAFFSYHMRGSSLGAHVSFKGERLQLLDECMDSPRLSPGEKKAYIDARLRDRFGLNGRLFGSEIRGHSNYEALAAYGRLQRGLPYVIRGDLVTAMPLSASTLCKYVPQMVRYTGVDKWELQALEGVEMACLRLNGGGRLSDFQTPYECDEFRTVERLTYKRSALTGSFLAFERSQTSSERETSCDFSDLGFDMRDYDKEKGDRKKARGYKLPATVVGQRLVEMTSSGEAGVELFESHLRLLPHEDMRIVRGAFQAEERRLNLEELERVRAKEKKQREAAALIEAQSVAREAAEALEAAQRHIAAVEAAKKQSAVTEADTIASAALKPAAGNEDVEMVASVLKETSATDVEMVASVLKETSATDVEMEEKNTAVSKRVVPTSESDRSSAHGSAQTKQLVGQSPDAQTFIKLLTALKKTARMYGKKEKFNAWLKRKTKDNPKLTLQQFRDFFDALYAQIRLALDTFDEAEKIEAAEIFVAENVEFIQGAFPEADWGCCLCALCTTLGIPYEAILY